MKLTEASIEFAKNHISKYWDSDFFPKSDVFDNLWTVWTSIKNFLLNNDVLDLDTTIPQVYAVPKQKGGYRIVHRLEPINAIMYTALAYMVAEKIELKRIPKEEKVACSYRIKITEEGDFFENRSFYSDFYDKSIELANKYKYVLKTDITDFYNQIYIHRLQNVIETVDSSFGDISNTIEKFILKINSNSSKGIPVGPAASIVFSEALMIDVDNFIVNKGLPFTRYVDDIRIFANDKDKLVKFLEEFSIYLYEQHRLNLSSPKTEILKNMDFLQQEINIPEKIESQERHKRLRELAAEIDELFGYKNDYIEDMNLEIFSVEEQKNIKHQIFKELLDSQINSGKMDLGLVRHILKQAKQSRCRIILPSILNNFAFFIPAIREVCLYLDVVLNGESIKKNKEMILTILNNLEIMNLSFVKYWIDWLVMKKIEWFDKTYFHEYFNRQDSLFIVRKNIALKNITFINSLKINYDKYDFWSKLEILQGIKLLPKAEKKAFLRSRQSNQKNTEKFLIEAIKM